MEIGIEIMQQYLLAGEYLTPQQRKFRQQQQQKFYTVRGVMEKLEIPLQGQGQQLRVRNEGNDTEFILNKFILYLVKKLFQNAFHWGGQNDPEFHEKVKKVLQHYKKFKKNVQNNLLKLGKIKIQKQKYALTQQQLDKAYFIDFLVNDFDSIEDIIYKLKIDLVENKLNPIGGTEKMEMLKRMKRSEVINKPIQELVTRVNKMYDDRKESSSPSLLSLLPTLFGRRVKQSK